MMMRMRMMVMTMTMTITGAIEPLHSTTPTYLFVARKNPKTGRFETRQINIFAHSMGADSLGATRGKWLIG